MDEMVDGYLHGRSGGLADPSRSPRWHDGWRYGRAAYVRSREISAHGSALVPRSGAAAGGSRAQHRPALGRHWDAKLRMALRRDWTYQPIRHRQLLDLLRARARALETLDREMAV